MNVKQIVQRRGPDERGFTLIELIIVIAIIGILVAIALPVYGAIQNSSRNTAVNDSAARGYETALSAFYDGDSSTSPMDAETDLSSSTIEVEVDPGVAAPASDFCVTAKWVDASRGVPPSSRGDC